MPKISTLILSYNEEDNIKRAIESAQWSDEIIVLDSFSTDNTEKIARSFPKVTFLQNKFVNHSIQRNFGIEKSKYDWIFVLDADELSSEPLQEELRSFQLKEKVTESAFSIKRINYFMGKKIRFCGWQNDRVIRLFDKNKCTYEVVEVHEKVSVKGKISKLKNCLEHYTYRGIKHFLNKLDEYSTMSATEKFKKGKKVRYIHLIVKPGFRFFKQFILNLGFLDGKTGFVLCKLSSYSVFLRYMKLWRMQQGESLSE